MKTFLNFTRKKVENYLTVDFQIHYTCETLDTLQSKHFQHSKEICPKMELDNSLIFFYKIFIKELQQYHSDLKSEIFKMKVLLIDVYQKLRVCIIHYDIEFKLCKCVERGENLCNAITNTGATHG